MGYKLETYDADDGRGYCEIHANFNKEMFYILYFDDNKKMFFMEEFKNKAMRYVTDAAENWASGMKLLEIGK
jgi:hypothetical protein